MNATLLRKVYTMQKIRKKKYRFFKQPKDHDLEKQKQQLVTMKQLMTKARNANYRLIFLDETCFTRKTMVDTEWSKLKENMFVDSARLEEPTLALLSAVSREKGQEHFRIYERSVNIVKFKQYLTELRTANGDDKICLFMD